MPSGLLFESRAFGIPRPARCYDTARPSITVIVMSMSTFSLYPIISFRCLAFLLGV